MLESRKSHRMVSKCYRSWASELQALFLSNLKENEDTGSSLQTRNLRIRHAVPLPRQTWLSRQTLGLKVVSVGSGLQTAAGKVQEGAENTRATNAPLLEATRPVSLRPVGHDVSSLWRLDLKQAGHRPSAQTVPIASLYPSLASLIETSLDFGWSEVIAACIATVFRPVKKDDRNSE